MVILTITPPHTHERQDLADGSQSDHLALLGAIHGYEAAICTSTFCNLVCLCWGVL